MEKAELLGPDFFNNGLLEAIQNVRLDTTPFDYTDARPYNELGALESMSVLDFLRRGEGIASSLKGRVKFVLLRTELSFQYLISHAQEARNLVEQFERFKLAKAKADQVLKRLREMLGQYDSSKEIMSSCDLVTSYDSAVKVFDYLSTCSAKIENDFMAGGTVRTYLPDRINRLKDALKSVPERQEPISGDAEL